LSGNLRYFVNRSSDRTTQFIYQYNDNKSQTTRLQTSFDGLYDNGIPDEQQNWQINLNSQTRSARWIDHMKTGKSPPDDTFGFSGQKQDLPIFAYHFTFSFP
jgi:hypothetical protein